MRSAVRSERSLSFGRPKAAQMRPMTPLLEGSRAESRSVNKLEIPQDCIGACKRNNNVVITPPFQFRQLPFQSMNLILVQVHS